MKETFYLFKRAADGVWIFGNNADCEHQAGICKPVPSTDRTTISIIYFQKNDATPSIYDVPVENFLDEAGVAYADFAALKAAYAGFFFSVAGSVNSDGFLYLPTSISSNGIRIGERVGFVYAIDRALTTTGFQGTEGVDWENLGGQGSV